MTQEELNEILEKHRKWLNDELALEEYNETITEEKEKELIEKQNALCKEFNEYVDTLKKKGKVFYELN